VRTLCERREASRKHTVHPSFPAEREVQPGRGLGVPGKKWDKTYHKTQGRDATAPPHHGTPLSQADSHLSVRISISATSDLVSLLEEIISALTLVGLGLVFARLTAARGLRLGPSSRFLKRSLARGGGAATGIGFAKATRRLSRRCRS